MGDSQQASINRKKVVIASPSGPSQPVNELTGHYPQGHQTLEPPPQWGQHPQDH